MDIINRCNELIDSLVEPDVKDIDNSISTGGNEPIIHTQAILECVSSNEDSNLEKILDQQSTIKNLIERDGRIKTIRRVMQEDARVIEEVRRDCAKISVNMMRYRQEQREEQAKELERFQLQQLKSIAEDHLRHQRIYEQRQQELAALKAEYDREESGRVSYLASVEKDLEKQLKQRELMLSSSSLGPGNELFQTARGFTQEIQDPNYIELDTVDEYALYGSVQAQSRSQSGRGRGRGSGGYKKSAGPARAKRGRQKN